MIPSIEAQLGGMAPGHFLLPCSRQVLKACLNLDDGALSWVMSQILAKKGPLVQDQARCQLDSTLCIYRFVYLCVYIFML